MFVMAAYLVSNVFFSSCHIGLNIYVGAQFCCIYGFNSTRYYEAFTPHFKNSNGVMDMPWLFPLIPYGI